MTFHPSTTVSQIAIWCQLNKRCVVIDWRVVGKDRIPIAVVVEDDAEDRELPMWLREQAI